MIKTEKKPFFVESLEEAFLMCLHMLQPMTAAFVEVWKQITNITCIRTPAIYLTRSHTQGVGILPPCLQSAINHGKN
jgi:hypothetical protein